MEKHSRDREWAREREEEGEGSIDRNAHQAWTVSGKWESVVPPSSSRCQGCGIPNYSCKFCTTASRLIIPDLRSFSLSLFHCCSLRLLSICHSVLLSFFLSLLDAVAHLFSVRLCLFFQPFLIFYLLLFALSLSLKKPNYSDVEWKWNYTDHSNLGCNYPLNAHTPLIFKITAYSTSFAQSSMSFYQSLAHSGWIVRFLEFIHCLRWRMKARHFSQCHQFEIPIICV